MAMILFEVFLKSIDLIPQQQILQQHYLCYRLYYLILWNQVDILQKHFKKDPYAPLDEVLRYVPKKKKNYD